MLLLLVLACICSGCSDSGPEPGASGSGGKAPLGKTVPLRIVAGSESMEIEEIIVACGRSNGVEVQMHYSGSVDMMLALKKKNFALDAVLPASSIWLRLGDQEFRRVKEEASIMRSPVGLGVKMVSDLDKLIQSKETFIEALAKADALAAQTVDAANKSFPVFQEASAELRKVIADHEGADTLESAAN